MVLKDKVKTSEFFEKLKEKKCIFHKICGLYPAKCQNTIYIGQKRFNNIEIYQLEDDKERVFFGKLFQIFPDSKVEILDVKKSVSKN